MIFGNCLIHIFPARFRIVQEIDTVGRSANLEAIIYETETYLEGPTVLLKYLVFHPLI